MNTIDRLLYGFTRGTRVNRKNDTVRPVYLSYQSPMQTAWNEGGGPSGVVWKYKGKPIAIKLDFYRTSEMQLLLRDNGDRSLPVFTRLYRILDRVFPGKTMIRSNARQGIWLLVEQLDPSTVEPWIGQKLFTKPGRESLQSMPSVDQRLKDFMNKNPVDLTGIVDPGPWIDILAGRTAVVEISPHPDYPENVNQP